MSKKGLIMSIEENKKAVVLTPSGEFCKVPLPKKGQYDIGDELSFNNNSIFLGLSMSKWGIVAAAVFVIMIMPLLWKNTVIGPGQEVAYVNIDINPSIELALNSKNLVIRAKGLNNDGKKVLAALKIKDIAAQEAIKQITTKAKDYKYLASNKENLVVISVTSKDKIKYQALSINLEKEVKRDLDIFNLKGKVATISASPELKAKADELNLSTGKYAVMLAAIDSGLNISPDEIRSKSIAKAIKALGGDVGNIVSKAHQVDDLDLLAIKYADKIKNNDKNTTNTSNKNTQTLTNSQDTIKNNDETNDSNNQDIKSNISNKNENDNSQSKNEKKQNKVSKKEENDTNKNKSDKSNKGNKGKGDKNKIVDEPVVTKPNDPTPPDDPSDPQDPVKPDKPNNSKDHNDDAN